MKKFKIGDIIKFSNNEYSKNIGENNNKNFFRVIDESSNIQPIRDDYYPIKIKPFNVGVKNKNRWEGKWINVCFFEKAYTYFNKINYKFLNDE